MPTTESPGTTMKYQGPEYPSFISFNIRKKITAGGVGYPTFEAFHVKDAKKPESLVVIDGDPWSEFGRKETYKGKCL